MQGLEMHLLMNVMCVDISEHTKGLQKIRMMRWPGMGRGNYC